jgi:hypothetical protein
MEWADSPAMAFIGLEVMPIFKVVEASSAFPVIPIEALLKIGDTARSPRGNYNRDDWEYERGKYLTSEQGHEEPVDDSERKMIEGETRPGLADEIAVKRGWQKIMRSQEKRIATKVFNDTNFTAHAVANEWDDATNATPITDVKDAKLSIRSASGMLPNTLIIAYTTYENLKMCAQIVDRLKYTFPGLDLNQISSAQLAKIFDVERVMIGGAIYDSAKKGKDTSIADLWDNEYSMLTRISSGQDITEPCIGRTFLWIEDSPQNPIVESYREEQIRSDIFRVRHNVDERLLQSHTDADVVQSNIAAACSYLFSNITTK